MTTACTPSSRISASSLMQIDADPGVVRVDVEHLFADHVADGADQSGLQPHPFQHALDQIRRRRFAFRAGYGEHAHGFGRVAVEGSWRYTPSPRAILLTCTCGRSISGSRCSTASATAPPSAAMRAKLVAVKVCAGNAEEQAALQVGRAPGIARKARESQRLRRRKGRSGLGAAPRQFAKFHQRYPPGFQGRFRAVECHALGYRVVKVTCIVSPGETTVRCLRRLFPRNDRSLLL